MADQQLSIFHLTRTDDGSNWGEYTEFVVIAGTALDARLLAGHAAGGNSIIWADPKLVQATPLGTAVEGEIARIVLGYKLGE